MSSQAITLTDNETQKCPFAAYKTLRDEHPVYKDPVSGVFIVTRYDDIKKVASNPQLFSNNTGRLADAALRVDDEAGRILREKGYPHVDTIVTADPPVHTKFRSMVDTAFRITRINQMREYIDQVARETVATFEQEGTVEFMSAMAIPMPMYIIADQLGVPRERYLQFKKWSDALLMIGDTRLPADARADYARAVVDMHHYLAEQTEVYRRTPADNIFSDVANGQVDSRPLTIQEVVSVIQQLLVAGNETTTNTMAMGLHMMITGGHEAALRTDPSKMPTFVEEALRLAAPLQGLFRRATQDTEIQGVHIPKDSTIMLRWAAGNLDERHFENPDVIDLNRKDAQRHITFGYGIHFCIGNLLARAELRTAFTVLLERLKNFRLADDPAAVEWVAHAWARGMTRLKIDFDRV